jgi:hypothetical protein
MVEPSPHKLCSGVSGWCVGNIEILGGLMEQLILVDRASRIETKKVWTVNPHTNRVGSVVTLVENGKRRHPPAV